MDYAKRVKALFAKAAGTDNLHEKEAFTEAAERLMVKWGIDESELAEDTSEIDFTYFTIKVDDAFDGHISLIASLVKGLRSLRTTYCPVDRKTAQVYIIGRKLDVDRFLTLYDQVLPQAIESMNTWWQAYRELLPPLAVITNSIRQDQFGSYLHGYGQKIHDRLLAYLLEEGSGAELVLVERQEEVDGYMAENFSNLVETPVYFSGAHAYMSGEIGGSTANLGVSLDA